MLGVQCPVLPLEGPAGSSGPGAGHGSHLSGRGTTCVLHDGSLGSWRVTELPPHPKAPGCNAAQESMKSQLMNKVNTAVLFITVLLKFYTAPMHISSAFSSPFSASQGQAVAIRHAAQHQRHQGEQGPEVVWIRRRQEVQSKAY